MAKPLLSLNIEQGPKSGSCIECKPASIASVGRARANTMQISKDHGISQKHVCFQWRDDANHVGWMAMDMGSSNGTIINDQEAAPHVWISLEDGDLIKIGAETSIRINIARFPDDDLQMAPKIKDKPQTKNTRAAAKSHRKAPPAETVKNTRVAAESHCNALAETMKSPCVAAENHGKAVAEEDDSRIASASMQSKPEIEIIDTTAAGIDLSMTVEQWFQHLMEEGPKYLHRVSEEMIQDILHESKRFDEYVMSLTDTRAVP